MGLNYKAVGKPPGREAFNLNPIKSTKVHLNHIKNMVTPELDTSVSDAATAAEAERRKQADATTARINSIYDSPERQAQYGDFLTSLRQRFGDQLGRQKTAVDRNNKFAIAARGLTGGSRDVDSRRAIGEEFQDKLLGAEDRAQSAVAGLKAQDTASRTSLIGLANNGLDATTAAQRAIQQLQQNTNAARRGATEDGIGDALAIGASTYDRYNTARGYREGRGY